MPLLLLSPQNIPVADAKPEDIQDLLGGTGGGQRGKGRAGGGLVLDKGDVEMEGGGGGRQAADGEQMDVGAKVYVAGCWEGEGRFEWRKGEGEGPDRGCAQLCSSWLTSPTHHNHHSKRIPLPISPSSPNTHPDALYTQTHTHLSSPFPCLLPPVCICAAGALFKALFKWFQESGPVYLLPTGPVSSFLVISDPAGEEGGMCEVCELSERVLCERGTNRGGGAREGGRQDKGKAGFEVKHVCLWQGS